MARMACCRRCRDTWTALTAAAAHAELCRTAAHSLQEKSCLANHTKPGPIGRGMQLSLHAPQGQEHSLDDTAAARAALCKYAMHRHADVQLPAHYCPGSPLVEQAHSWGAFRDVQHLGDGCSSASGCFEGGFDAVPDLAALSVPISCHRATPTSPAAAMHLSRWHFRTWPAA